MTLNNIIAIVEEVFECEGMLKGDSRKGDCVDGRIVYSTLAKRYFKKKVGDDFVNPSSTGIGKAINRDHSTVLNHFKRHEELFTTKDRTYMERFDMCEAKVRGLTEIRPVDFKELLQFELQTLSQEKCKALLTIIQ